MTRYETGRKQASIPFILCHTLKNVSSPLVGYLGKRFGLGTVTAIGCLLGTIGVGACFFAEDIIAIIFFWGIVFGFGFGMAISLIPQILSQHFEEHLGKATGIVSGGMSAGTFIIPLIADRLLVEYGMSGMFLILSGILLNSVPAALQLRNIDNSFLKCKKDADGLLNETSNSNDAISESIQNDHINERNSATNFKQNIETSELQNKMPSQIIKLSQVENDTEFYTDVQQEKMNIDSLCKKELKRPKSLTAFSNEKKKEDTKNKTKDIDTIPLGTLQNVVQSEVNKQNSEPSNRNLYSKDSKRFKSSSSKPNTERASNSFHVFLDVAYILILLTQGFMLVVITTILTIIVDASKDKGVAESDGVYILICLGVTNMIGGFYLGYITDGGYMTKINFQILCLAGFSVFNILFIFLEGFVMVMIAVGFAGLFTVGHFMIGVGIICQYIEKEYVTMALASQYFAFALFSFAQVPLIGFFRENLKSYDGLFILLAAISGICIALAWFTPIAAKKRHKKNFCNKL